MNEESTRESETPTREGGDDVKFELESPPAKDGQEGGDALAVAPRQGFLSRIFRRREQPPAGQAAFGELMGVMHSIKNNLELQSNAQARLLEALEHFPEAVDGLKSLGKVGENQEQMLGLVRKQVEDSAEHGKQVVDSINRFDSTLHLMDETSRNTAQTMVGVAERSRESEEVLRTMLERSEKRLTYLLGTMGLLTIVVIAGVLFLSVGGGLNERFLGAEPGAEPAAQEIEEPVPVLGEQEADEPAGEHGEPGADEIDAEAPGDGERMPGEAGGEETDAVEPDVEGAAAADDVEAASTGETFTVIVPLDPFEVENPFVPGPVPGDTVTDE